LANSGYMYVVLVASAIVIHQWT